MPICIKRRKCRRIDPKSITDWKDYDQYFNKDGNQDGNRATIFSTGRQNRTSKSRRAKPKKKFGSTNAQQSSEYLITVPGREDEFNAAVWIKDLNDQRRLSHKLKSLQFPHHKISSSHIEREQIWEMVGTKSQNHPFCTNLILRVFTVFSRGFHGFSLPFQSFFHGVTIFANLKGAPSIFQAWDIFGGGIFLGIVSQKYDFKNNHIEETSVVKA